MEPTVMRGPTIGIWYGRIESVLSTPMWRGNNPRSQTGNENKMQQGVQFQYINYIENHKAVAARHKVPAFEIQGYYA